MYFQKKINRKINKQNRIAILLLTFFSFIPSSSAIALDNSTEIFPVLDKQIHKGVASCAGSMCHGSVKEYKQTNIQHNEYITWDKRDVHSRAYNKLFNKDFISITNKLGLKAPHEEPVCLACHASNVAEKLRGSKFFMSDGIGCETCHGGAEKWLKSHTNKKATHTQNLEKGLYPTDNIVSRARLCMSCHYGNKDQFVTHDIMGAGHPRISFELDTFTELQPKHFTQDKDYAERKTAYSSVKAWAVGQAVATESVLEMLLSNKFHGKSLFPELSMFDCHSCHHPMSDKSWQPKKGTGLKPGSVPLNDSSLLMLRHVLAQINKGDGWRFKKKVLALHSASAKDIEEIRLLADEMLVDMPGIIDSIEGYKFTAADIKSMTSSILNEGIWGGYNDYVAAEQCVMAISVLTISWDNMKAFNNKLRDQIKAELDTMYTLVADDEAYDQSAFRESLILLRDKLIK